MRGMCARLKLLVKLDAKNNCLTLTSKVLFSDNTYFIVFASVVIIIFFIFDSCMSDIDVIHLYRDGDISPKRLF